MFTTIYYIVVTNAVCREKKAEFLLTLAQVHMKKKKKMEKFREIYNDRPRNRCQHTFGRYGYIDGVKNVWISTDTYLSLHSGGGLGRQLVPEHVHLGHRGLRLMRLLVKLLAQQLHFVLYAQRGHRDAIAFGRFSHRRAIHLAAVLKTICTRNDETINNQFC